MQLILRLLSLSSLGLASGLIAPPIIRAADSSDSASAEAKPVALDESALDRKVSPCEDFYTYSCGGWIAKTTIPADRPGWSRGFFAIAKRNEEILRKAFEADATDQSGSPEHRQLGDYYAACMDETKAEASSVETLKRRLATLATVKDPHSLAVQTARAHLEGANVLFGFGNEQDAKDSSLMIAGADQGGLGLPDRDYYLSNEPKKREIRALYKKHIATMLALLGDAPAKADVAAASILALELRLAKASMDRVERRDPEKVYHRLERAGLKKLAPTFDWDTYFATLGVPQTNAINVSVPAFFTELEHLLKTTPSTTLQTYLRWKILSRAAPMLAKRFVDENFAFSAKAFTGQKELEPRWKRCVGATVHALNHPSGRAFVEATFRGSSKADTQAMITEIEQAFGASLGQLSWMDPATREEASGKLKTLVNQVGYPDRWRDYASLKVSRDSYLTNAMQSALFESRFHLNKIGRTVDRTEWEMPASIVNAYYDAENNKMVFPAGILQPPFFDAEAPLPVNYGGIGMVMGHELTHGFDDQGRKFDAKGNLRDWWSASVAKEFEKGVSCLDKQYSSYVVLDDVHVNGKLTMGENIADQGGIRLTFAAWMAKTGGKGDVKAGFTPAQQLFIGYAQSWCQKLRPERTRVLATVDPHSPAQFRVNGPLANFEEFSKAFSCKEGDKMAPVNRCKIW